MLPQDEMEPGEAGSIRGILLLLLAELRLLNSRLSRFFPDDIRNKPHDLYKPRTWPSEK